MNTFSLFAELGRELQNKRGRCGILLPTAIATDETYKRYLRASTETKLWYHSTISKTERVFSRALTVDTDFR